MTREQALETARAILHSRSTLSARTKESLHQSVAIIGGVLRCEKCGAVEKLGDVVNRIYGETGWPEHCGYTMTWVTGRQLRAEAAALRGTA